ncbi:MULTISPECIES: tetratricopeptide repeat protein [Pseudomonas]|uniref:Sel1 repeat protein n=1 Tax=Pseudomonas chlororaphis O6 TaxID=1037915 RepID=A0AB33X1W2_9PSED|nr:MULTISPECIES: tetratricopeptide repeat protein [Pseudomonas]EIM19042.1 Sel1 repeat protein [Pseudomonas chlororaphis O6]WDG48235.1 tetratricopeptide repeat protein [Pseudomonas chlororaphis]WDG60385.1 tetratricopeptide repeat protein [Pseudomonas chlororaphis]WDG66595.1 tetratricopeptide repeat protein [Pseudomonas chlororaphis]
MRQLLINLIIVFFTFLFGGVAMAYDFKCAHEKDTAPPLDQQADQWFKQARSISKERLPDWPKVAQLYQQAVEKNHWKAMHNLAELYLRGDGVPKDTNKAIDLYLDMVKLEVPLGYYDMSVMTQRGVGVVRSEKDAMMYLLKAGDIGSPLAQVRLGNIYIYDLKKRDLGVSYLRCAAHQNDASANYELAEYYEIVDKNYPVAMHYYQQAAALGERKGAMAIERVFKDGEFSYQKDKKTEDAYYKVSREIAKNPDLRFPNLAKDYPLPPNPVQGYHADKDINWKPTGRDDDY